MTLSRRVIETLVDLVEIKLSCIEVYDREDTKELASLERCRKELHALLKNTKAKARDPEGIVAFPQGRGRPRAAI
jgi:hypothetical protein